MASAILVLAKSDHTFACYPLLRNMLEADIDARLIMIDNRFYSLLSISTSKKQLHLLRLAMERKGFLSPEAFSFSDIRNEISKVEDHVRHFEEYSKSLGFEGSRFSIEKKFSVPSSSPEYDLVYRQLCTHSHSSLSYITSRYLKANGDTFNISVFHEGSEQDHPVVMDGCYRILVSASKYMHTYYGTGLEVIFT
jgi:hypothetical protein